MIAQSTRLLAFYASPLGKIFCVVPGGCLAFSGYSPAVKEVGDRMGLLCGEQIGLWILRILRITL